MLKTRQERLAQQCPKGYKEFSIQDPLRPTGTQDEPGRSGITTINASNYYTLFGNIGRINTTFTDSRVSCLPGDVAINSDFRLFNMDPPFPYVTQFASTPSVVNQLPTGWITSIQGQPPQTVTTYTSTLL